MGLSSPSPSSTAKSLSSSRRRLGQETKSSSSDEFDVDLQHNPFRYPKEDVLLMREREKREKMEAAERVKGLKIWEKGTSSSAVPIVSRRAVVSSLPSSSSPAASSSMSQYLGQSLPLHAQLASQRQTHKAGRASDKENMADFLAKKKDMFLIQMSLDTKRAEIQMLEEKAQMKEDALKKSEMMLEEDAMRFDIFLKDNDRAAHDAMKMADKETKEKQEKQLEIKKLMAEIHKVDSDIQKYEEKLSACTKYKDFLDRLTPQDVRQQQAQRRRERRQKKKEQQRLHKLKEAQAQQQQQQQQQRQPSIWS